MADQDVLSLLGSVQISRISGAAVVVGLGDNQRDLDAAAAREAVKIVQQYSGRFTNSDRVQPYTWDFEHWGPRRYTPMVFMISVREEWDDWGITQRGEEVPMHYMHINTLSVYDVNDDEVYDARQSQGSAYYELAYHTNSIQIAREDVKGLIDGLGF